MVWIYRILGLIIGWKIVHAFPVAFPKAKLHDSQLSIYYGAPGSGKSTYAAWLAQWYINSGIPVYSNVPIKGCMEIKRSDLGRFAIVDGLVIIDEAGLEFNNRDTGSFTKKSGEIQILEWFKKHRHEGCELVIFSQGFDDMDKKIRTLGTRLYLIRKSLIPNLIVRKTIKKAPKIDETTHQPIDAYDFVPLSAKRIYAPCVWHLFDSFDRMTLPIKLFHVFGQDDYFDVRLYNDLNGIR